MNEQVFRLTPADVRAQEFRRSMFGYEVAAVEEFRTQVADEMERLIRERIALDERLNNFRDQLKAFREREKSINDAVVLAQQVRKSTEAAAKEQSQQVIGEAQVRAEKIMEEARGLEAEVRRDLEEAQRQFTGYLAAFRQLLWRQMAQLDALAEHERDGTAPETK